MTRCAEHRNIVYWKFYANRLTLVICILLCAETVPYPYHRGDTVRLACNTTLRNYVQWNYGRHPSGKGVGVYENGQIDESYTRVSVEYPLIIRNAIAEDAGYYACVEDAGSGSETVKYHLKYEGIELSHAVLCENC